MNSLPDTFPAPCPNPCRPSIPPRCPQGKRVVFSCAAGVRSVRAIEFAQGAGRDIREHYKGGFKDWAAAGEPVE